MRKILFPIAAASLLLAPQILTSCLDDNDSTSKNYSEWRQVNTAFFQQCLDSVDDDGQPYFERLNPDFATGLTVLVRRHNASPAGAMRPMDNSVCNVVYQGRLYDDTVFDSSYSKADSVYQCVPMDNVSGFWAVLTTMAEGDSVTAVLPASAAYDDKSSGDIKPYSTLVFEMKLKKIVSWDSPMGH